jgi:hypothetical protein
MRGDRAVAETEDCQRAFDARAVGEQHLRDEPAIFRRARRTNEG